MFNLASLFTNAMQPGGPASPGAYAAQGTNSAWLMPDRLAALSPAAQAVPQVALPVARPAVEIAGAANPAPAAPVPEMTGPDLAAARSNHPLKTSAILPSSAFGYTPRRTVGVRTV